MALLALLLVCGAAWWAARSAYHRPGPLAAASDIVVPRGSLAQTGTVLARAGVVANALEFRLAAYATRGDGPVHAAEFAFPAHASLRDVLATLRHGRPVQHAITIPEGLTAAEIARLIAAAGALTGPVTVPPEGAVLPQTYDYTRGTTRAALIARAERAMRETLALAWATRDPSVALSGPRALLVLASLVEGETGQPAERPMVAGVFLNRLRLGMKLQSDPTAAYEAAGGLGSLSRKLARADLAWPGPVNTYVIDGLPPSPICAPGLASIEAAAHPAATDALYFVANGLGGHVFASTLAEHDRNVARYRQGSGELTPDPPAQGAAVARSATRAAPGAGPRRPIGRMSRPPVSDSTSAAAR